MPTKNMLVARCDENGIHAASFGFEEGLDEWITDMRSGGLSVIAEDQVRIGAGPCSHFAVAKALATDLRTLQPER